MRASIYSTVQRFLLVLLFAFPILPLRFSGALLLIAVGFGGYYLIAQKQNITFEPLYPFIWTGLLAFLYLVYPLWADSPAQAWFEFEKRAGLLAIPIGLFTFQTLAPETRHRLAFMGLVGSSLFLAVGVLVLRFMHPTSNELPFYFELRSSFEAWFHIHPTYFGLCAALSIVILLRQITTSKIKKPTTWLIGTALTLLFVGLALIAARMALVAALLGCFTFLIRSKKLTWLLFLVPLLLIGAWLGRHSLLPRMQQVQQTITAVDQPTDGTSIRLHIYSCSLGLVNEFWIFGVGSDNVQNQLNGCYTLLKYNQALEKNLNSHNEFLNQWLTWGLAGLILLIGFFVHYFARVRHNPLFTALGLVILLQLLTENLLSRQHGMFAVMLVTGLGIICTLPNKPAAPE